MCIQLAQFLKIVIKEGNDSRVAVTLGFFKFFYKGGCIAGTREGKRRYCTCVKEYKKGKEYSQVFWHPGFEKRNAKVKKNPGL